MKTGVDPIISIPAYGNVSKIEQPFGEIRTPEPLDVAWISENYHDFKNMGMFSTDTNAMDRAVFAALKPGGVYVISDYVAAAGSGTRDTQSLHRIDPEVIKREVTAAGFTLEAEGEALMNPSDGSFGLWYSTVFTSALEERPKLFWVALRACMAI